MSYDEQYYQGRPEHPMWQVESRIIAELAGPVANATVVDMGCGAGDLLATVSPGIGIDAGETAIRLARERFGGYEFRVGDVTDPELPANSVDCIISLDLIEHLEQPAKALRRWRDALVPGGRLVVLTASAHFPHQEIFEDPDHKCVFAGPQLTELLEQAGMTVTRAFTAGPWAFRTWPGMWRLRARIARIRMPELPWLRWRGQTLCVAAYKDSTA